MSDRTMRVITIKHIGSEPDWRIAVGIIFRQILRGVRHGQQAGRWEYTVEIEGDDEDE